MHSERSCQALLDILENATLAQSFVGDLSPTDFAADRRSFYAAVRCLEIISEASRRLDEVLLARHPELPWRAIRGSGKIYRHSYDSVAEVLVWRTVRDSLPPLLSAIRQELDEPSVESEITSRGGKYAVA